MDAFAEGYTFSEKNLGSYTGATIGDAYVGWQTATFPLKSYRTGWVTAAPVLRPMSIFIPM